MSAKKSNASRMLKRFSLLEERYRERLERQSRAIDRLVMANAAYADGLHTILQDATNIKQAKELAEQTHEKVATILAVPNDEEESTSDVPE